MCSRCLKHRKCYGCGAHMERVAMLCPVCRAAILHARPDHRGDLATPPKMSARVLLYAARAAQQLPLFPPPKELVYADD